MSRRALIEVKQLKVEFPTRRGRLTAVEDVSLEIMPGEVVGVVGESGAGKSVTGLAIAGLIDPPGEITSGEIHFEGQRIDNLPEGQRRRFRGAKISMIFQDPLTSLDPLFTIGDQLVETIRTHAPMSNREARARAIELLTDVGIPAPSRRVDDYPHQLSGGMRQRVVIALALCTGPRLIVADEPTTALDVSSQAQVIARMRHLCQRNGTAVMLVTHDIGVIAEAADRVAVMYAGRIVEMGAVHEVIQSPKHPYTVGLMGAIPSLEHRSTRLVQIDGYMPRLDAIPSGCAFHPRCPRRMVRCALERPKLQGAGEARISCWLFAPSSEAKDGEVPEGCRNVLT